MKYLLRNSRGMLTNPTPGVTVLACATQLGVPTVIWYEYVWKRRVLTHRVLLKVLIFGMFGPPK